MNSTYKTGSVPTIRISFLFILLSCLFSISSAAQQKINLTLFAGLSNYSGDLQEKRFTLSQSHAAAGLGVSYEIMPKLFALASLKFGKVSAADKFSGKTLNHNRNLDFYSAISEFSLSGEYHLKDLFYSPWTPYITGGIAVFRFNPHAEGIKNLRQYSTEGQGVIPGKDPYKLTVFSIPFGGGIKYRLSDNVHVGLELVIRKSFTDYLDDVSTTYADENLLRQAKGQAAVDVAFRTDELVPGTPYPLPGTVRGSPASDDWYYFTGLTLSVGLGDGTGKIFGKKERRGSVDCPPM